MCGIVGYVGKNKKAQEVLLNGLKSLEYRGYDSAGIAFVKDNDLVITKEKGKIANLEKLIEFTDSNLGIGHTRWATHGVANRTNSHPHKQGKITIVHNGIIENYAELKEKLINEGVKFNSTTDTEVAAALLNKIYNETNDMNKTIVEFEKQVKGAYALGIICDDDYETLYTARMDSPLIIALGDNENYIASDVPAVIEYTNKYMELNNGDFAKITADKVECFNKNGEKIEKETHTFPKKDYAIGKNGYDHIMLKEIHEQPDVVRNTISPYFENGIDSLLEKMPDFSNYNKIVIVACGSAMHAGLVGKNMIEEFADIPVEVKIASEFRYDEKVFIDNKSLVIGVSQSGETADTLKAIERAKKEGADTLGIISKEGSTIARNVDFLLYTNSGLEIAVATTKAYSAQIALLSLIALNIANHKNNISNEEIKNVLKSIKELPVQIDKLLNQQYCEQYKEIAETLYDKNDIFFIGRGIDYALCMEGSLKLKEISYIHSEAYAAGELKHGTISLIEPGTPVIGVITDERRADKTLSNIEETGSRGSDNYMIITDELDNIYSKSNENYNKYKKVIIPKTHKLFQPLLTVVPLQMIAYETAKIKGEEIDTPRNLAKSVTVE